MISIERTDRQIFTRASQKSVTAFTTSTSNKILFRDQGCAQ
jgi:hypothetical protein